MHIRQTLQLIPALDGLRSSADVVLSLSLPSLLPWSFSLTSCVRDGKWILLLTPGSACLAGLWGTVRTLRSPQLLAVPWQKVRDLQEMCREGRSTHKLWENGALEELREAALLQGRSLVHLQVTLVWGGQQERLQGRKHHTPFLLPNNPVWAALVNLFLQGLSSPGIAAEPSASSRGFPDQAVSGDCMFCQSSDFHFPSDVPRDFHEKIIAAADPGDFRRAVCCQG